MGCRCQERRDLIRQAAQNLRVNQPVKPLVRQFNNTIRSDLSAAAAAVRARFVRR